jgi:hypothetical protein
MRGGGTNCILTAGNETPVSGPDRIARRSVWGRTKRKHPSGFGYVVRRTYSSLLAGGIADMTIVSNWHKGNSRKHCLPLCAAVSESNGSQDVIADAAVWSLADGL